MRKEVVEYIFYEFGDRVKITREGNFYYDQIGEVTNMEGQLYSVTFRTPSGVERSEIFRTEELKYIEPDNKKPKR